MTRPIVVECVMSPKRLYWRWCCSRCATTGTWLDSLNEAERAGAAHNRKAHEERAVQA